MCGKRMPQHMQMNPATDTCTFGSPFQHIAHACKTIPCAGLIAFKQVF